jgi:type IV secretory pathway TrbD component
MMATGSTLRQRLPTLSRRSRRLAVVAAFAGYPLMQLGYVTLRAPNRIPTEIWGPIAIALFAATLVGVFAIYGYSGRRMDRRRNLDERQLAMIDRAMVVSYGVLTAVIGLLLGGLALWLTFGGPITFGMGELTPFIIGAALYEPVLPFAALAWIEPDLPADDEA